VRWRLGVVSVAVTTVAVRLVFAQTTDDAPPVETAPAAAQTTASPPPSPAPSTVAGDTPPATPAPRPGLYTHDGFYLRYSIGPAAYRIGAGSASGDIVVEGPSPSGLGVSEILAIGGTFRHGVVLAGASSAVVSSSVIVANYGLLVDWFPDPAAGWHIGGELGVGVVRNVEGIVAFPSTARPLPAPDDLAVGLGASLIGGYDAWVTPQFSMGINLIVMTTAFARQTFQMDPTTYSVTPIVGGAMVSVLYH
jgi:hypothetical protein